MFYRKAFQCKKCPESNGHDGCPCWLEIIIENDETGHKKVEKGCFFQTVPLMMLDCIQAANQATEQSSKVNNNLINGLCDVGNIMMQEIYKNAQIEQNDSQVSVEGRSNIRSRDD